MKDTHVENTIIDNLLMVEEKYAAVSEGNTIIVKNFVIIPAYKELIRAGRIKDNNKGWEKCTRLVWELMMSLDEDNVQ